MQYPDDWNDFLYFLKVADCGSLKAASTELGVNNSTVFRRINSLEEKLQVRLFDRLKTGYLLTDAGRDIIDKVREIEMRMHSINRTLHGKDSQLGGTIRISTTDTIGYYWLPSYIASFKLRYPEILLDIDIRNRFTNLSANEADIVIPAVNTQPDYMVGRKLAQIQIKLCASRAYVDRFGKPNTPEELRTHRFIAPNKNLAGLPAYKWLGEYLDAKKIMACSNRLTGLHNLARQHLGITLLPHYVIESDPELIALMNIPVQYLMHIWILTHPDLRENARIRTFMRFMYHETRSLSNP